MQMVSRYQNLLHRAELVESQLKESFSEYLNAEIALRTVTDVSMAISWLKGSFFYIRVTCMLRVPASPWVHISAHRKQPAFEKL